MAWTSNVAIAAAVGAGVFLVVWNAKTFRLEADGATVLWVALVTFGVIWPTGERWFRAAGGIAAGMLTGVAAYYGTLVMFPITPLGRGIGIGVAASVLALACMAGRRYLSMGSAMIGYGIGTGMAVFAGIRPTSGIGDIFELWMALGTAAFAGAFGARLLRASAMQMRRRQVVHTEKMHVAKPTAHAPRRTAIAHVPGVHLPHVHLPHPHLPHVHLPKFHLPHLRRNGGNGSDGVVWDEERTAAHRPKRTGSWP